MSSRSSSQRVHDIRSSLAAFDRDFNGRGNTSGGAGNPTGAGLGQLRLTHDNVAGIRRTHTPYDPLSQYSKASSQEDPYYYQSRSTPTQRCRQESGSAYDDRKDSYRKGSYSLSRRSATTTFASYDPDIKHKAKRASSSSISPLSYEGQKKDTSYSQKPKREYASARRRDGHENYHPR